MDYYCGFWKVSGHGSKLRNFSIKTDVIANFRGRNLSFIENVWFHLTCVIKFSNEFPKVFFTSCE